MPQEMVDHDTSALHRSSADSDTTYKSYLLEDFACKQCDYKTKRFANLKRHGKARHEEKKFMCALCNFR